MSISGVPQWPGYYSYMAKNAMSQAGVSATQNSNNPFKAGSVEQGFMDEIKKPAGQRMVETWLKAHHLTEEDLKNMPPEKRNAILKQMAQEIEEEMKRKAQAKAGAVELLV